MGDKQGPPDMPKEFQNKLKEGLEKGAAPALQGKYVAIPAKYYTTDKSELKTTVKKGDQTYDITLTSK
jgi:hypothetical protein